MAKHNCAICGTEVGLMSGQKLADGNYICRKVCGKKCFKVFDQVHASLTDVNDHIAQIERGTKIWQQIFVPLQKTKNKEEKLKQLFIKSGGRIYVSPSTGLIALVQTNYKIFIFGKTERACVYRLADLVGYEYESEKKIVEGQEQVQHFCRFTFVNTAGLSSFRVGLGSSLDHKRIKGDLDRLFGIEKTRQNSLNNAKRQFDAAKAMFHAVKDIQNGTLDESGAAETIDALNAAKLGDRSEWIAKADAALASVE